MQQGKQPDSDPEIAEKKPHTNGYGQPATKKKPAVVVDDPTAAPFHKGEDHVAPPLEPFRWRPWSFFMRMFFLDVDPLVAHGYRVRLEPPDIYPEESVLTDNINKDFLPAWKKQLARQDTPGAGEPSLKLAIWAGNGWTLFITGVFYAIAQACSLAGPLLLQRIVAGISCSQAPSPGSNCEPRNTLYYYCIGLFLAPAIQSVTENHQNYLLYLMGTRMRNALMATIYRKCLKLSNSSLQAESTGKVVTLMSNDAQKLQDAAFSIHTLWGSPCLIVAILVLLYQQVGWATFVGLGVMLGLVPITAILVAKLAGFRRELMGWTDKRVGLMSEVISGIQMIKFMAWESPFTKEAMVYRGHEARIMRETALWQGIFGVCLFVGPVLVAVFCFGSYSIAGNTLSPAAAYAALSYFSLLRFPMSFLPMMITMWVNALIAIARIQGFLLRKEAKLEQTEEQEGVVPGEIIVEGGCFVWDEEAEKTSLTNIELKAAPGSLTMVVGSVGSGKSSLLSALIGHMSKRDGKVSVGGKIAYVAQTAWVMNETLQDNVIMGSEMEPEKYRRCLQCSQLGPDLKILPQGDLTEIGDRGVTLSGGQKQRVSLARAVYHDSDVYLLDDPLSAVDSHVGRALFDELIRFALKGKTVILITNALQYLPQADNVLWMEDGAIKAQGTYQQLVARGLEVADLAHIEEDEEVKETAAEAEEKADALEVKKAGHRRSIEKSITLKRQEADANRNLTGVEDREEGTVSWNVVKLYFSGGGSRLVLTSLIIFFALEQGARCFTDAWVGLWFANAFGFGITPGWFYLGIYFLLGVLYGLFTFIRSLQFLYLCINSSVNMFALLLTHILCLPKSFFDTNPSGRILNRFSRDTDIMDATLPQSLIQFAGCIAILFANIIVIAIATRWFAIAIPFLIVIYVIIQRFYIPTARELQRIEALLRSPIYSKFGEALQGVPTIRAYRKESHFTLASDVMMEKNAQAFVTMKLAAAWLAMRLDVLGVLIVTGTGALCIASTWISPGLAGLAILYALDLTRYLKHGTAMASKSESDFNSVERIVQYLEPEREAEPETRGDQLSKMTEDWPSKGAIQVNDLFMRYRPEMPLVLRGVSFNVLPGHKVGLVGRTGSGKSSILLALFRMVEPEAGTVVIDGVDVSTLGVRHLRSKMSIIPQDPFLYKGTVRRNLDPLENHNETELWEVVETVGLKPAILALETKMDHMVVDQGTNFSLGQRQLFCLARAMLRKSRILMLDEATASVDLESDANIQSAIRTTFKDCTMLTIAHRLNTIMDSDHVVVLEAGKVKEQGEPEELLQNDKGVFSGFVEQTGKSSSRYLRSLASSARMERTKSMLASIQAYDNRTVSVLGTYASFAKKDGSSAVLPGAGGVPMDADLSVLASSDGLLSPGSQKSTSRQANKSFVAMGAVEEEETVTVTMDGEKEKEESQAKVVEDDKAVGQEDEEKKLPEAAEEKK